jgi:glycosyltransferase involved in cell wall biosynthesis
MNVHLTIGGEGPQRKSLETKIERLGLESWVRLVGYIPADQLPDFYGAADFFILPTRELEGFGLVTVESLACGTPVLGTPIGGTPEILHPFDPSFLFRSPSPIDMADGIQAAAKRYADKDAYRLLRQRCRHYAESNYSWSRHVAALEKMILSATA